MPPCSTTNELSTRTCYAYGISSISATNISSTAEEWYPKNVDLDNMTNDFARQLALSCYMFDHAVGFTHPIQAVTRRMYERHSHPPGDTFQNYMKTTTSS
jgi:hypothetical protein